MNIIACNMDGGSLSITTDVGEYWINGGLNTSRPGIVYRGNINDDCLIKATPNEAVELRELFDKLPQTHKGYCTWPGIPNKMSNTGTVKISDLPIKGTEKIMVISKNHSCKEVEVDADDVFVIDPDKTYEVANNLSVEDWENLKQKQVFIELFHTVFRGSIDLSHEPVLQQAGLGVMHVVGMLILLSHAENAGMRPLLRYPETSLHPNLHGTLADLFVLISNKKICNFKTDEELCDDLCRQKGVTKIKLPPKEPTFTCITCSISFTSKNEEPDCPQCGSSFAIKTNL